MYKLLLAVCCAASLVCSAQKDKIELSAAQFKTGDDKQWALPAYDDKNWPQIRSNNNWEAQGYDGYNGYAWYRFHFDLPSSILSNSYWKDSLRLFIAKIDDADEVYLNGVLIAKHGSFPSDKEGYITAWDQIRELHLSTKSPNLYWDKPNLLAIKVYDGDGAGGIFGGEPFINIMDLIDGIRMKMNFEPDSYGNGFLNLSNTTTMLVKGEMNFTLTDTEKDSVLQTGSTPVTLAPNGVIAFTIKAPQNRRLELKAAFSENNTHKSIGLTAVNAYILTPAASPKPRINGASVFGVRPSSPFLFKVAATGDGPLVYEALNLPQGLQIDKKTGVITGFISKAGEYKVNLVVKNKLGSARKELLIKCGNLLALTPPMGWNSWNCWGLSVSDAKLRSSALALINTGLIDHGWNYMNIDDGWEAAARNDKGEIVTNDKFPNMPALGDWLHAQGLKFGIYSSPGTRTCGGFLGSYQHEQQDATTYASWGIDYLKYDWCSYGAIHGGKDTSLASYAKPYEVMQKALRSQNRDIVYSLCQYGMKNVWQWGDMVDGNCWRTTGDIEDSWESLKSIGFNQNKMSPYAKPGRWNDPDMLIVGNVGWGENLHPTRLNPDEQYTHISLWCLLSSPLLIGCDISRMDAFTLSLLTNDEMIEINQDRAGKQARQILKSDEEQVWSKDLNDGSKAVGLFNLSDKQRSITLPVKELKLPASFSLRDCWRQKDLGKMSAYAVKVPPHGVVVLRVRD